ncbi:MAG: protease inhibitor I9 family protein [Candidatus Methanoperedens sp.]|nr:protease inhibitor I9 family protein [Candidatus Methanoperedens sp.]
MKTKAIFIASILMILLIPPIDAKPVIIGFTEEIDQNIIKEHGIANYTQYKIINAISANVPENVSKKLKKNPKIKYIEEDAIVQIARKPSPQPQPAQQITWGIEKINAPLTWNNSTGKNVKIAVMDTGISSSHPDSSVFG